MIIKIRELQGLESNNSAAWLILLLLWNYHGSQVHVLNFTHLLQFIVIFSWYLALLFALEASEGVEQKKIHLQRFWVSEWAYERKRRCREKGWWCREQRIRQIKYAFKSRWKLRLWTAGNWKKNSFHNPHSCCCDTCHFSSKIKDCWSIISSDLLTRAQLPCQLANSGN